MLNSLHAHQNWGEGMAHQERAHGKIAVILQCLSEHMLQMMLLTRSVVNKQRGVCSKNPVLRK